MIPPTGKTFLVATFVQAIFYGVYLITLVHALRWVLYEDKEWEARSSFNLPTLVVTLLLFIFSTTDLCVAFRITLDLVSGEKAVSKKLELLDLTDNDRSHDIRDIGCVPDVSLLVVYAKSWRIIVLPLLIWLSNITCAVLFDYWLIIDLNTPIQIFTPQTRRVAAVFFCCTFVNNIYVTCAISYRILRVARRNRSSSLYITSRIFAESGILCASTTLMLLVTSSIVDGKSLPEVLAEGLNFSMMGIAFNLILVRVGKQRANQAYFL